MPSYVEGGGLYRMRHLLTSYVTRWGIDAIMSAHYRCLVDCWYLHDQVSHMAEWLIVIRVDTCPSGSVMSGLDVVVI